MYQVEIIPNTSSTATPGWTYVPNKAFDPAKAAIAPSLGRKRGIRADPSRTDVSSRQTNAIVRHLAELDKENYREVAIQVPARQRDPSRPDASRGTRTKTTSNVRRILQSQKTFRNYLDDEEAAIAQGTSTGTPGTTGSGASARGPLNRITKPSSASRRSLTPATPTTSKQPLRSSSRKPSDNANATSQPTPDAEQPDATPEQSESQSQATDIIPSEHDNDPLLKSYIPSAPSERIMCALLSEPPLTYNASRARPPITGRSERRFCCICGYWGKIRCRGCHQRTCGSMKCYETHGELRCGAFYVG
ncbi:hypothetical protein BJX99DRAFT_14735 [Aspergillus californicus]